MRTACRNGNFLADDYSANRNMHLHRLWCVEFRKFHSYSVFSDMSAKLCSPAYSLLLIVVQVSFCFKKPVTVSIGTIAEVARQTTSVVYPCGILCDITDCAGMKQSSSTTTVNRAFAPGKWSTIFSSREAITLVDHTPGRIQQTRAKVVTEAATVKM